MNRSSTLRLGALVAACVMFAGACSSDKSSSDTSAPGTSAASVDTGSDSTAAAVAETTAAVAETTAATDTTVSSSGGVAADRSGQTIKVGFVNMDGGPFAFPEFRIGGELAIKQINDGGGINGAKLEVVSCSTDLTPEKSIDCANQLVQANVAIAYTAIDLASDAALPIYQAAGIPYVTTNNWGAVQSTADGSHLLHLASDAFVVGALELMSKLGVTKMANLYEKSPAAEDFVTNVVPPLAKKYGVDLKTIGIDAAAPDWTSGVATAQAGGAEVIYGQFSEPGCTALIKAARAAKFAGTIIAGACNAFLKDLGDDAVGVYTLLDQLEPSTEASAPPEIAKHLADWKTLMDAAGQSKYVEGYALWPFGAWMELREVLRSIDGEITAKSVEAALDRDVKIPGWFGADLNCGAALWPSSKANCSATLGVYQTKKDGDTLVRTEVIPFFDAYAKSQGK